MVAMITVGIDLASQPKKTALCEIEWDGGGAHVVYCESGVDDYKMKQFAEKADKVGIDAPFGWPCAFVAAITGHSKHKPWPCRSQRELRLRRTDCYVWGVTRKQPLSVSSDRIACTAFRVAAFLSEIAQTHGPIDRTGAGKFVEVYPRAARNRWTVDSFAAMLSKTSEWLEVPEAEARRCHESADCFDALVAALIARAAEQNLCDKIPEADREAATIEGWIAIPTALSLRKLA